MDIIKPTEIFIGNYRFDTYNNGVINAVNIKDEKNIHMLATEPEFTLLNEIKLMRESLEEIRKISEGPIHVESQTQNFQIIWDLANDALTKNKHSARPGE